MARVNPALGFQAQDNFPSDLTDGRESTKGFLGQQAPATARHTSRRICPPWPPPGGRSCSARRLKSFSRLSFAEFRRDDHFPEPRVACLLPAIKDLRRHNDFALVAKRAGLVALHCTVAGDVPIVCALPGGPVWRVHHVNCASLVELAPTATKCIMRTALVAASRSPGIANNRPHTGRPGQRFVFVGRSGPPRPNPELPLAFSFRGHDPTTLPWRLASRPPWPCLRS